MKRHAYIHTVLGLCCWWCGGVSGVLPHAGAGVHDEDAVVPRTERHRTLLYPTLLLSGAEGEVRTEVEGGAV